MFTARQAYVSGQIARQRSGFDSPEPFYSYGCRLLGLLIVVAGSITYFFIQPDITKNPVVVVGGYYNICIAIDYFPMNYIAGMCYQAVQALFWLNAWRFLARAEVAAIEQPQHIPPYVLWAVRVGTLIFSVTTPFMMLCFMRPPRLDDPWTIVIHLRSFEMMIFGTSCWFLAQWIFAVHVVEKMEVHYKKFTSFTFAFIATSALKLYLHEAELADWWTYPGALDGTVTEEHIHERYIAQMNNMEHNRFNPETIDIVWLASMLLQSKFNVLKGWHPSCAGEDARRGASLTMPRKEVNSEHHHATYLKAPREDEELNAKLANRVASEFERCFEVKHEQSPGKNEDWGTTLGWLRATFEITESEIRHVHPDLRKGLLEKPARYEAIVRLNCTTGAEARMSVRLFLPEEMRSQLLINSLTPEQEEQIEDSPESDNPRTFVRTASRERDSLMGKAQGLSPQVMDMMFAEDLREFFAPSTESVIAFLQVRFKPPSWSRIRWLCTALAWGWTFMHMHTWKARQEYRTLVDAHLPPTGVFGKCYFSGLPFRLGPGMVKFGLLPFQNHLIGQGPKYTTLKGKDDIMSFRLAAEESHNRYEKSTNDFLKDQDAVFDFAVQIANDARYHSWRHPQAIWSEDMAPYISVGTLRIHKGQQLHMEHEGTGFNVWNTLIDHRPVGPLNNARAEVYKRHSAARNKAYGLCPFLDSL